MIEDARRIGFCYLSVITSEWISPVSLQMVTSDFNEWEEVECVNAGRERMRRMKCLCFYDVKLPEKDGSSLFDEKYWKAAKAPKKKLTTYLAVLMLLYLTS